MTVPDVSILMLVYEHQEFVAQSIESVLNQKCDFQFELIIINDCSNDRSGQICRTFAEEHPSVIRFVDNQSNMGMHQSFQTIWNMSRATLVAFCEGDDFWVDDSKLQTQVNLMQQNSGWNLCGAKAQTIELSNSGVWRTTGYIQPLVEKTEYSFDNMISAYHFHFSTVILRKQAVEFPEWFQQVYCVDRPIYLIAVGEHKAGYLNRVVSSYRIHSGGNWSSISGTRKALQSTDLFLKLAAHFDRKYAAKFEVTLFNILQSYVAEEMLAKRYGSARKIFGLAFEKLGYLNKLKYIKQYYRTAILLFVKR